MEKKKHAKFMCMNWILNQYFLFINSVEQRQNLAHLNRIFFKKPQTINKTVLQSLRLFYMEIE